MFDGIDTTIAALARYAGPEPPTALVAALQAIASSVTAATEAVENGGPAAAAAPVAAGLTAVRDLRTKLAGMGLSAEARDEIDHRLALKVPQFEEALVLTHGIRLEALADDGTVVVGQPLKVTAIAGNNGAPDVTLKSVAFSGVDLSSSIPAGVVSGRLGQPNNRPVPSGGAVQSAVEVRVKETPLSSPYWTPRTDADRYEFEPGIPFGVPFTPTPFRVTFELSIAGTEVRIDRDVEYRYSDLFAGEKRMELQVVPPFNVRMAPEIAVFPLATGTTAAGYAGARSAARTRTIDVTVGNNLTGAVNATASLKVPAGWTVTPASAPVKFDRAEEEVTVSFTLTPPAGARAGEHAVEGVVTALDNTKAMSNQGYEVVEYPHIHRRHVIESARTRVKVVEVAVAPNLRVGYIMGVGDQMPAAIRQLGAEVHLIDARELASGDLARYNVIVTGVRAYERRPDLRANNTRLLDYVEQGGVLLVNYNKLEFNEAQYGPYPAKVGQNRITDENAPVEVLVPDHPVFTTPNRLGANAWEEWVQERGTYFLGERDARYTDLIRLTDPFPLNAGPKTGALVEARYGKGRWIYLGLGLWRQLPAGTDGAYKLLANLLSLGKN
jgi:hypothetical protein